MTSPEGYILSLLVVSLFLLFSVSQILQGKDDIKNSRRTTWFNCQHITFATILLIWFVIIAVVVLGYLYVDLNSG